MAEDRDEVIKEKVEEAAKFLSEGCRLIINPVRKYVLLSARCGGSTTAICDFARDRELCVAILESLVARGLLTRERADELRGYAEDHLVKIKQSPKEATEGVEVLTPGRVEAIISKLLSVPRNDYGAVRELRDAISQIVESTSRWARIYHALGLLTEKLIISRVGITKDEVMALLNGDEVEYLSKMVSVLAEMADVYEKYMEETEKLREEVEELRRKYDELSVDYAYLEAMLEEVKQLADPAARLREAFLAAIAANAPPEVLRMLIDYYMEAILRLGQFRALSSN